MKKVIGFIMLLFIATASFSQAQTAPALTKEYYLRKAKIQKIVAISLVSPGATCIVLAVLNDALAQDTGNGKPDASWLYYVGGGMTLASVPLFIASHKNKVKALSLAVKQQPVNMPYGNHLIHVQPTISLQIGWGR